MPRTCLLQACILLGLPKTWGAKKSTVLDVREGPDNIKCSTPRLFIPSKIGPEELQPLLTASPQDSTRHWPDDILDDNLHSPRVSSLRDSSRSSRETLRTSRTERSSNHAPSPSPQRANSGSKLQAALIDERHEWPAHQNSSFIPVDSLQRLLQVDAILDELKGYQLQYFSATELQNLARLVSETAPKLFAILVSLGFGHFIGRFIDEGIDDEHLPFERSTEAHDPKRRLLCSKLRPDQPIKCMNDWKSHHICSFDREQWCFLAPVFDCGNAKGESTRAPHYKFHKNHILPFLRDGELEDQVTVGGFSTVWEIMIHPAHHRFHSGRGQKIISERIALKRLHSTNEEDFRSEVEMIEASARPGHPHLIKLLATYQYRNRYYLLFPFAKSNLRKLWEDTPVPKLTADMLAWSLSQCKAIASGLHWIHEHQSTQPEANWAKDWGESGALPGAGNDALVYGRHGDIKPENILCFDVFDEGHIDHCRCLPHEGILVIADFGLMDVHKKLTRSKIPAARIGGSHTYQPPEMRLEKKISRAYDIWSLGCLYIEFITWLVCGWEGLRAFQKSRETTESPGLNDDAFYTIVDSNGRVGSTSILRESVRRWIDDLHDNPRSSLFIHDFLDLVSEQMLVVDSSARIKSGSLNLALKEILALGNADPSYYSTGCSRRPRKKFRHQERLARRFISDLAGLPPDSRTLRKHNTVAFEHMLRK